jgi:predicted Fe-Mo cluster-binding NifX family protein
MARIAVTASTTDPSDELDQTFGRCRYFLIFDDRASLVATVDNTATEADSGAGARAVQILVRNEVTTVLTGRVGPKAEAALRTAGIAVRTGSTGPAGEAAREFLGIPPR